MDRDTRGETAGDVITKSLPDPVPIRPGLFRSGPDPRLLGSRCPRCGRKYFPAREVCPGCFNRGLEECLLESRGTVRHFTTVHAKPPRGFISPYVVGYVDLVEDGISVPAILTGGDADHIRAGDSARLVVEPLSGTREGSGVLVYKFRVERPVEE